LSMIGLLVEDMGRSLGFYRTLGLTIPEGYEEETHVEVEVGGGLVLFWDAVFVRTYDPNREKPNGGYRIVPEFFVVSEEAVDALCVELVADGHRGHKAPQDALRGVHGEGRRPGRQHRPAHGRLATDCHVTEREAWPKARRWPASRRHRTRDQRRPATSSI
jgi:hypothetical protein